MNKLSIGIDLGGVMMVDQVIIDSVNKYTPKYCWAEIWERCDIKIAQLRENAGSLGAAAMYLKRLIILNLLIMPCPISIINYQLKKNR